MRTLQTLAAYAFFLAFSLACWWLIYTAIAGAVAP